MSSIETKAMDRPDESRTPEKTMVSVVHLGGASVARLTVNRDGGGWSASSTEADLGPGDAYRLEPGHDAWELQCHEPFVALEFASKTAATYAKS